MRKITEIIIHCSATPAGRSHSVEDIRRWHLARGFVDCGYHYVIYIDGSCHVGRREEDVGAHCIGHNSYSIGVCYIGGLSADGKKAIDSRTLAQKRALRELLSMLRRKYPAAKIRGHRDFAAKACPCFDATAEYSDI